MTGTALVFVGDRHVAAVDIDDLPLVIGCSWSLVTSRGGKLYARGSVNGVREYMHRVIAQTPAGMQTDHRDGNGLNNQRANLRSSTSSENHANIGKYRLVRRGTATSPYKGVSASPNGKWDARIAVRGVQRRLGRFATAEQAARAYDQAAVEAWGPFAVVNFPIEVAA